MFPDGSTVLPQREYTPERLTSLFLSVFNHIYYIYIYILIKIPSYNNNTRTPIRGVLYSLLEKYIKGVY